MKKTYSKYFYKNPVITGIIGFLLTLGLTQYLTYKDYLLYQSSEQQNVIDQKNLLEKKIVYGLRYGFSAIKTLAYLEENYGITGRFDRVAHEILETNQYIDAIQLLEGGKIRHVYPLEGNESVLGYNILEDPTRNKEAIKAMELGSIFFAGPFELKQGGMGIVGRQPIFKDNSFWGFAAIVIKLETFYKMIDYKSFENSDYYVQFSKTNPDTGILENFLPESDKVYTGYLSSSNLPLGNWKLSVQLKKSTAWINVIPSMILKIVFSVFIGLLVWYLAMIPAILKAKVAHQSRKIKESNERFEYATMATSDAIWDWDIQHNRVFLSENFEKMFGYKKNRHINNTDFWDSIIHPDDLDRVKQNLEQVLTGSDTFWKQEFQIKKSNGGLFHVMDTMSFS